jgi:hypothetical protein
MKCDSRVHSWPAPLQAFALVASRRLRFEKYSGAFNKTSNSYQYTYITLNMVLDESKLCYGHEIGFGQAINCKIHHPSG